MMAAQMADRMVGQTADEMVDMWAGPTAGLMAARKGNYLAA